VPRGATEETSRVRVGGAIIVGAIHPLLPKPQVRSDIRYLGSNAALCCSYAAGWCGTLLLQRTCALENAPESLVRSPPSTIWEMNSAASKQASNPPSTITTSARSTKHVQHLLGSWAMRTAVEPLHCPAVAPLDAPLHSPLGHRSTLLEYTKSDKTFSPTPPEHLPRVMRSRELGCERLVT
jgi:hypothetical protein